jgi:hypothetical protein
MNTDDLIRAMAADTVQPAAALTRLQGLPVALALSFAGLWLWGGFRADLGLALRDPVSAMRIVLTLGLAAIALWAALRLARPAARVVLWPLAGVAGVALGLWVMAYVSVPSEALGMAIQGKTMVGCLTTIPLLAVLPTGVVLYALRAGAPTRPRLAGAIAGLAGAGLAAAIYALQCTEDSPLFYVTWYGTAILGVTAVSALIAGRVLRW